MRWVGCILVVVCFASAENYKCDKEKKCAGSDQCCNTRSFFNLCCPKQSSCCVNGPKVKCCGPLDVCCNEGEYSGVACCPKNYRCCGSGRYGGLRNTCCYKVPAWLWIVMGMSLSLILLMLLLSLVECFLEQRETRGSNESYDNAYNSTNNTYPSDYGTYPSYNSNDLYNEPRYEAGGFPPRTPPPRYSADTPPEERATSGAPGTPRTRGDPGNSPRDEREASPDDSRTELDESEISSFLEADESLQSVNLDGTEADISSYSITTEQQPSCSSLVEGSQGYGEGSLGNSEEALDNSKESLGNEGGVLENTWERYLKKRLQRKRGRSTSLSAGQMGSTPDDLFCSPSQITLDSGIVDVSSDSDSSFHCSSWEDEEDIRQGNEIVYELNSDKGISRVPRLQTLVRTNDRRSTRRTPDGQTTERVADQTNRSSD